jgi:SAM-dependent methyltransferase
LPKEEDLKTAYSPAGHYQTNKPRNLSAFLPHYKTIRIINFLKQQRLSGRLLDVGCSNGQFMYHLRPLGFLSEGVELNPATAAIAERNGFRVFQGQLSEAKFADQTFDVVNLGDLIEHVPNPRALIEECRRILKVNGVLIISTPNFNCWWNWYTYSLARLFRTPWPAVTPPLHLQQFSAVNLDQLLTGSGFGLVQTDFVPTASFHYEFGLLKVRGDYRRQPSVRNLFRLVALGLLFSIGYAASRLLAALRLDDSGIISYYKKNA